MTLTATHMALLCRKHGTVTGAQSSRDTGFENSNFLKIQYIFLVPLLLLPDAILRNRRRARPGPAPGRRARELAD